MNKNKRSNTRKVTKSWYNWYSWTCWFTRPMGIPAVYAMLILFLIILPALVVSLLKFYLNNSYTKQSYKYALLPVTNIKNYHIFVELHIFINVYIFNHTCKNDTIINLCLNYLSAYVPNALRSDKHIYTTHVTDNI